MNYIRHKVNNFISKSNLNGNITLPALIKAANGNGILVKPYSASRLMLIMLGMAKESKSAPALCVKDQSNIMVFYDDALSRDKTIFAIAHELGHIELGHSVSDKHNIRQEKDANMFAHYLLTDANRNYDKTIRICAIALLLCLSVIALLELWHKNDYLSASPSQTQTAVTEPTNNEMCYYTDKGVVYHIYRDCQYLKNCDVVLTDTISRSHKERLCSACKKRCESKFGK